MGKSQMTTRRRRQNSFAKRGGKLWQIVTVDGRGRAVIPEVAPCCQCGGRLEHSWCQLHSGSSELSERRGEKNLTGNRSRNRPLSFYTPLIRAAQRNRTLNPEQQQHIDVPYGYLFLWCCEVCRCLKDIITPTATSTHHIGNRRCLLCFSAHLKHIILRRPDWHNEKLRFVEVVGPPYRHPFSEFESWKNIYP